MNNLHGWNQVLVYAYWSDLEMYLSYSRGFEDKDPWCMLISFRGRGMSLDLDLSWIQVQHQEESKDLHLALHLKQDLDPGHL